MSTCTKTLSWDSVLCQACRDFFDHRLSPTAEANYCLASSSKWHHSVEEIEACAGSKCRLCRLIFLNGEYQRAKGPTGYLPTCNVMFSMYWDDEAGYSIHIHHQTPVELDTTEFERVGSREPYSGFLIELPLIAGTGDRTFIPAMEDTTNSPGSLCRIRDWLQVCQKHEFCNNWARLNGTDPGLPKRLIHVGEASPTPRVSLVRTDDLPSDLRYATLSHCWGSGSGPLKLGMQSLKAFERDIPWTALPATFQDALRLVLSLNIDYLWIDALCIVQDNIDDWSVEAASMANVYANAVFNISADHAADSTVGLFSTRDVEKVRPFVVPCKQTDKTIGAFSWLCHPARRIDDIFDAPLNHRAWVVQERFLARGVVHFTSSQIYWECGELSSCESFPLDIGLPVTAMDTIKKLTREVQKILTEAKGGEEVYELWNRVSHVYALGELTREADRAVAVSGIARVFCHHLRLVSSDYLCGLFRPRFVKDLLWARVVGIGQTVPSRQPSRIPSWSWLSVTGGIWRPYRGKPPHRSTIPRALPDAVLLEASSETSATAPFGTIGGGYARVQAALCRVRVSIDCEQFVTGPSHQAGVEMHMGEAVLHSDPCFSFQPDNMSPEDIKALQEQELYLMLGQTSVAEVEPDELGSTELALEEHNGTDGSHPSSMPYPWSGNSTTCAEEFRCLLLEPGPTPRTFRRMGLICFGGWQVFNSTRQIDGNTVAAEWAISRAAIERHFRTSHIPQDMYEAVEEDMMYTIKLV